MTHDDDHHGAGHSQGAGHSHDGHDHADHDHGSGNHSHDHDHGHAHGLGGHSHAPASFGRAFAIGVTLNTAYVVAEAFWGLSIHSVALLADAGHNFGDVIGLAAAWAADWLGRKPARAPYTYGLRRASILAALANAVLLLVATGAIAWEAVQRLLDPQPTGGLTIVIVGLIGVLVNGFTAWLFMAGRKGDLNVRGAYLHMVADASLTLGVAVTGLLIMATGWERLDPAVSLVIAVVIVAGTWGLLRDSVRFALDAVPPGIEIEAVRRHLAGLPGITGVHDLHVWPLSTTETALTAHLVCPGAPEADLTDRVAGDLRAQFGIGHVTVQVETPAQAARCALGPCGSA